MLLVFSSPLTQADHTQMPAEGVERDLVLQKTNEGARVPGDPPGGWGAASLTTNHALVSGEIFATRLPYKHLFE